MSWEPKFIRDYVDYTQDTEPPEVYRKWVAISLLAACAEMRLWVKYGDYRVPLHQYIMLTGPSGARKTTAIDDALQLLEDFPTDNQRDRLHISSDSITRESLMIELSEASKSFVPPGSDEKIRYCALYAIAREFFAFFRSGDKDFWRWLVAIYDGKPEAAGPWTYKTKLSGQCTIERPCLNFLGATTPEGLAESIPKSAIGSGFTARITFVFASRRQKARPFPQLASANTSLKLKLKGHLNAVFQRVGEITWAPRAQELYSEWYADNTVPEDIHPTLKAWYERLANFVIRLSGISVLAEGKPKLIIDEQDVQWAVETLEAVAEDMPRAFVALGTSRIAVAQHELFEFIRSAGAAGVSRGAVVSRFLADIEARQLNELLDELKRSGMIREEAKGRGVSRYIWTGEDYDAAKLTGKINSLRRFSRRGL